MPATLSQTHVTLPPSGPRIADPCTVVMFGVSGDLAMRKLAPALYYLKSDGLLSDQFALVGIGAAGTWRPSTADALLRRDGRGWHEPRDR